MGEFHRMRTSTLQEDAQNDCTYLAAGKASTSASVLKAPSLAEES